MCENKIKNQQKSFDADKFQKFILELRKSLQVVYENMELCLLCEALDYLNDPNTRISDDVTLSKIIMNAGLQRMDRNREAYANLNKIIDKELRKSQFVDDLKKMLEIEFCRSKEPKPKKPELATQKIDYSQLDDKQMFERLEQIRNK